jgi:hypothetical protein
MLPVLIIVNPAREFLVRIKILEGKRVFYLIRTKGSDVISILLAVVCCFCPPNRGTVTFISPTGSVQLKWQIWILGAQFTSLLKLTKILVE